MKTYIINGRSKNIGQWEIEIFNTKEEAEKAFENYVNEYEATVDPDNEWFATADNGYSWFELDEREVDDNTNEIRRELLELLYDDGFFVNKDVLNDLIEKYCE